MSMDESLISTNWLLFFLLLHSGSLIGPTEWVNCILVGLAGCLYGSDSSCDGRRKA